MTSATGVPRPAQPPAAVRAAFALYLGEAALALLNAVVQVAFEVSGAAVLVGALVEAGVFVGLAVQMRAGRQWARMALMAFAWVFLAFGLLAAVGLRSLSGPELDGTVLFALACVVGKVLLIIVATVLMFRRSAHRYFS